MEYIMSIWMVKKRIEGLEGLGEVGIDSFNDNSDTINTNLIWGINYIVITSGIYNVE